MHFSNEENSQSKSRRQLDIFGGGYTQLHGTVKSLYKLALQNTVRRRVCERVSLLLCVSSNGMLCKGNTYSDFTAKLRVGVTATEDVKLSMRLARLFCEYFKEECKLFL